MFLGRRYHAVVSESPIRPGEDQPAVPASTVMLLRNGSEGIEVFMLERHIDSDFVGGAYVFPGGKVDAVDRAMPRGTVPDDDRTGFRVAAVRESFEECGVLLARQSGHLVDAETLRLPTFLAARRRLTSRGDTWDWRPWLVEQALVLDLDALVWWSWWVTPAGVHRRFDTRFFVAHAPVGQLPSHDDVETTDSRWVRPQDALAAAAAGSATIILPTRKNLEELARFPTAEAALAAPRPPVPERIQPRLRRDTGGNLWIMHDTFANPEPP